MKKISTPTVNDKFMFVISIPFVIFLLFACSSPSVNEKADEAMNNILHSHNAVGLSVAVVKDNQLVYTGSFGYKNLQDSSLITTDDIFRIASISKSFTATAIMQLLEAGKFSLDDDVSVAMGLPVRNPNFPDTPITYRMLLSHTSSLSDKMGYFTFDVLDPEKTADYAKVYNDYIPGSDYEYCNLGFNMLGALVEIHSGERFDQYIKTHILEPLQLNGGFNVDDLDRSLLVSLYEYENGNFVHSPDAYESRAALLNNYQLGRSTTVFSPTGGMKIVPKDLAKHMLVQMNKGIGNGVKILSPESVIAMQTPYEYEGKNFNYGFAIRTTSELIEGEILKGHTGSAYGLYSSMFFEPDKKFGFIMMTNGYPPQRADNGFMTIQTDVINELYRIFIATE